MYSSTSGFYAKCCQAGSTYKALHDPWCHIQVLRVYPTMLQVKSRPAEDGG